MQATNTTSPAERNLIFLSHANPEDSDFAVWLANKLTLLGHRVWLDDSNLGGGAKTWREIEDCIRNRATIVVVALSRSAIKKDGVLNEINLAANVAKSHGLKDFIVPLRIDELSYRDELPVELVQLNVIDFSNGWRAGLTKLEKQLKGLSSLKGSANEALVEMSWRSLIVRKEARLSDVNEQLYGSWLPIELPSKLYLYDCIHRTQAVDQARLLTKVPTERFDNWLLTFAEEDTLEWHLGENVKGLRSVTVDTEDFLYNKSSTAYSIERGQRRVQLSGLLNQAWNNTLASNNWLPYQLAFETAWYLPKTSAAFVTQRYIDPIGNTVRTQLTGVSDALGAQWHIAISAHAAHRPELHFATRLHVAFTSNGRDLIGDPSRMAKLRRRFCKMWFNERWRRLFFGVIERLYDGKDHLVLSVGSVGGVKVLRPITVHAGFGIPEDPVQASLQEVDESPTFEEADDDMEVNYEEEEIDQGVEE